MTHTGKIRLQWLVTMGMWRASLCGRTTLDKTGSRETRGQSAKPARLQGSLPVGATDAESCPPLTGSREDKLIFALSKFLTTDVATIKSF